MGCRHFVERREDKGLAPMRFGSQTVFVADPAVVDLPEAEKVRRS